MKKGKTQASSGPFETKVSRRKTEEPPEMPPCILDSMPKEIYNLILSRMPVRDAVRTSVLSKAWRSRWRDVTGVIFDESCIPRRGPGKAPPSSYYAQLACKYIGLSGVGGMYTRGTSKAVNRWLVQNSELLDHIAAGDILIGVMVQLQGPLRMLRMAFPLRPVPLCLIDRIYQSTLRELVLDDCDLNLRAIICSGCGGYPKLENLTIKGSVISADHLGGLISSCPLLSRLTLDIKDVSGTSFTTIVMSAPHLRHLEMRICGSVRCIHLVAPQLVSAWISLQMFNGVRIHTPIPDGGCNLVKLLGESPQLEKLTITSLSLQFLCVGTIPFSLRQPLNLLERLELSLNFNSPFHAKGALCLFRSSPTLKRLHIDIWPSGTITGLAKQQIRANVWDTAGENCSFPLLENLVINGLNGMDSEIVFLRFVLLKAPLLAVLDIKKPRMDPHTARLRQLVLNELQDLLALRRGMTRITIR